MGVTFIAPQGVYTSPAKLIEKTITENGTFTATDDEANGYSQVAVSVPSPTGKITITENGTNIDIAQYAKADVNVAGGGGSSDFSTAEVTVGAGVVLQAPVVINEEEFQGIAMIGEAMEEEMIWQVPLYKGKCVCMVMDEGQHISVSGNITEIDDHTYHITGDCTITIS